MILTKELLDRFFGVVNRGNQTDAREWLLEVLGKTPKEAKLSAADLTLFSKDVSAFAPPERRNAAKDTRPEPREERRNGAPDLRPFVSVVPVVPPKPVVPLAPVVQPQPVEPIAPVK